MDAFKHRHCLAKTTSFFYEYLFTYLFLKLAISDESFSRAHLGASVYIKDINIQA